MLRFPLQITRIVTYNIDRQGLQLPRPLTAECLQNLAKFLPLPKVGRLSTLGSRKSMIYQHRAKIHQIYMSLQPQNPARFSRFSQVFVIGWWCGKKSCIIEFDQIKLTNQKAKIFPKRGKLWISRSCILTIVSLWHHDKQKCDISGSTRRAK